MGMDLPAPSVSPSVPSPHDSSNRPFADTALAAAASPATLSGQIIALR